jgi:hypothetical protein
MGFLMRLIKIEAVPEMIEIYVGQVIRDKTDRDVQAQTDQGE